MCCSSWKPLKNFWCVLPGKCQLQSAPSLHPSTGCCSEVKMRLKDLSGAAGHRLDLRVVIVTLVPLKNKLFTRFSLESVFSAISVSLTWDSLTSSISSRVAADGISSNFWGVSQQETSTFGDVLWLIVLRSTYLNCTWRVVLCQKERNPSEFRETLPLQQIKDKDSLKVWNAVT